MSGELTLRNRQRNRPVNLRQLRAVSLALLEDLLGVTDYDLSVQLVGPRAMAGFNWQYLQHEGPTDVITLDYAEGPTGAVTGEIIICVAVAVAQSRDFGVPWQEELVRYVVHGVLHLRGHDDLQPAARRRMKREEDRLVRKLKGRFFLRQPGKTGRLAA